MGDDFGMNPATFGLVFFVVMAALGMVCLIAYVVFAGRLLRVLRRHHHHVFARVDASPEFNKRSIEQNRRLRSFVIRKHFDQLGDTQVSSLGSRARIAFILGLALIILGVSGVTLTL